MPTEPDSTAQPALTQIRYDPAAENLEIAYADGTIYRYLMVPQFMHRALLATADQAAFARQHIHNGPYAHARLAEDQSPAE